MHPHAARTLPPRRRSLLGRAGAAVLVGGALAVGVPLVTAVAGAVELGVQARRRAARAAGWVGSRG
jgi:hypothetical protein